MADVERKSASSLQKESVSSTSGVEEPVSTWDRAAYKRAVFKMDLIIVPITTFTYLLSFLDRANIGNARVAGLQKELKLTNYQFSVAVTCTYVLFIASEVPMNLVMKKFGANYTIPAMTVLWGLVTASQGAVKSYKGLIAARLFLGLAEGGLLPGLVLYMSFFYRRHDLASRISWILAMTALAGAFSGLLATAIANLNLKHGISGWKWIFIIEGIVTIGWGLILFVVMPRKPSTAPLLSKEEVTAVEQALEEDWSYEHSSEKFSVSQCLKAFTSPHLYLFAPAMFFNGITLFGLSIFAPTIINALGNSPNRSQLLTVPPYACAFLVAIISAIISDRIKQRGIIIIFIATIAIIGYAVFLTSPNKHVSYGALFLQTVGAYATAPCVASWQANNYLPYYRRATAIAWGFVMTNSGGIVSTWIFTDPPKFKKATRISLAASVGVVFFSLLNTLYLRYKNAEKAKVSAEERKSVASDEQREALGDRHPDFLYTP